MRAVSRLIRREVEDAVDEQREDAGRAVHHGRRKHEDEEQRAEDFVERLDVALASRYCATNFTSAPE